MSAKQWFQSILKLTFGAIVLLSSTSALGATYYVRTSGSDTNSGTSPATAFKTISKAASVALAGDKVYVGGGTYTGRVQFAKDGTAASPIQFIADIAGTYTGDVGVVVVDGGSDVALEIKDDNYISVLDFSLTGKEGVHVENAPGASIQNCTIYNTTADGVFLKDSLNVRVDRCYVLNAGSDSISVDNGSCDVTNCLLENPTAYGITAVNLDAASSVWHTTVYSAGSSGIRLNNGTLTVYNSIVSSNAGKGLELSAGTFTHNYNIVYNNTGGNFSGTTQTSNEWTVDPLFTSTSDFHLQTTSPAIDKGTSSSISVDKDNNSRPVGSASDLGCYEGQASGGGGGSGVVYYVRVSGNDSNDGKSPSAAFRTIKKAATVVQAGQKVYIGAGVYTDAVIVSYSGAPGNYVEFIGDTTGTYTGDVGTVAMAGGKSIAFKVSGKDYVSLANMQFGGDGSSAGGGADTDIVVEGIAVAQFESAFGGKITNCRFKNGKDALRIKSAEVSIINSSIDDYEANGIYVDGSTSKLTITGSSIYNCGAIGIMIKDAALVDIQESTIFGNGSSGIRCESDSISDTFTVKRCQITGNRDGFHFHGAATVTIENCVVAHNTATGLMFHGGSPTATINHCTIAYNTVDGANLDHTNSCTLKNCIVAFNLDDGIVKGGASHNYNLVYGNGDKNYDGTSAGAQSLSADPKFNSLTDLKVQTTSPGINQATGSLNIDLDGNPRPVGAKADLGAYEQVASGGSGVAGKDYYVRSSGNDSKNGLNAANAFKTIAKAVSVVIPGDRVWVGAGTYTESLDLSSKVGTALDTYTFTADTTGAKTGDAGNVNVTGGFYVRNAAYVKLDGFRITVNNVKPAWSSIYAGALASASSRITFQSLQVTNGEYGVYSTASTNVAVSSCTATTSTKHGFAFVSSSTADLTNCSATSCTLAGVYAVDSTVNTSNCTCTSNGTRGFHFTNSRGTIANSSASSNSMAAELSGISTDRSALTVSNLTAKGCTQGALLLTNCTADVVQGNATLCTGGSYGAYLTNSRLTLRDATISGTTYGVQAYNSSVASLNNCTVLACTSDAMYLDASTGHLTDCTVSNCAQGAHGVSNSTLNATNTTFSTNTSWGINHSGYGSITGCTSNKNGKGLCLIGAATRGDITINSTKIQGSTGEGLMAVRCTGSLIAGNDKLSKSGAYGVYLLDSNILLTGVEIASPQYGVQAYGSDVELDGVTITGCQYDGVYMDDSMTVLRSSTISTCRQGVWGENDSTLVADTCTFANHSSWAMNHTGYGSIDGCQVNTCAKGVYLDGASQKGDITISNTTIQGTTGEGIALINCTGDIVAGADKLSKGGVYGAYLSNSELSMPSISISGTQYGIQAFNSSVTMTNGLISGCSLDGIYGDQATTTLTNCTITGCRYGVRSEYNGVLNASQSTFANNTSWGVHHAGTGSISDCTSDKNYQGLHLTGAAATGDITLSNTKIQGTTREGLYAVRCTGSLIAGNDKLSKAGDYGAYLSQSDLSMAGIQITGPLYGVMSYSSTLNLSDATISDVTNDGVYASQSTTSLISSTIARCKNGVNSDSNGTLNASNSTIDACTTWGVVHTGYGSLTTCTINNCEQGMYLTGVSQNTDIVLSNTKIQGTNKDGLVATLCSGTVAAGTDHLSKGGTYGAYLSQCNLALAGVSITGSQRGVVALNSTVGLSNATIAGTIQTGVYTEGTTLNFTNSTVSNCGSRGIDCQLDSTLNANSLVVQNCADWGLAVSGFGAINTCQLLNNQSGANLVGKTARGNITLSNLVISGSTGQGLIATRCSGTVQGGADSLSKGGAAGINATDSQLTLTSATIDGATNGIQSTLSDLTIRNVTIKNATKGVYSDKDQNLILDLTRISNCSGWGLHQVQGTTQTSNCLLTSVSSGFNFDNASQAKVWNTTVTTTGLYGVYQNSGTAEVKNTILSATNGNTGIHKTNGTLISSNNLIHGYTTNSFGFTPDSTHVYKSPRFTNAAGGDYSLAKGSPAINAGTDLAGYVDADLAGSPRPAHRRWEIGAYEYLQQGASLRILQWAETK